MRRRRESNYGPGSNQVQPNHPQTSLLVGKLDMEASDLLQVSRGTGSWLGDSASFEDDSFDLFEAESYRPKLSCECVVRDLSAEPDAVKVESGFPPQKKTSFVNKSGVRTDIVCTSFSDHHFVVISQVRKFGTLIKAWVDRHGDSSGTTFEMNVLLGKRDDTLLTVYARQIIERISHFSDKPLLLAIALQGSVDPDGDGDGEEGPGRDADTFSAVLNRLFEISTWV